jgi:hypothetical protein
VPKPTFVAEATILWIALAVAAFGQNNPIPQIVGPVHPDAVAPGSGAFTLSVYGANFVPGSVVNWNYQPRVTTYISGHEIQAQILATDVATNTAGFISVTNPPPGGGSSSASWAQVEVHNPISTITKVPSPLPSMTSIRDGLKPVLLPRSDASTTSRLPSLLKSP